MFLNDTEIVVLVTPAYDGQIGCFVLETVLKLRNKKGLLSNLPHEDFTKGYDVGSIGITPRQEKQVQDWLNNGRYITIKRDFFGKFSFSFCTKLQLKNKGLTDEDFMWIDAWCESADYQYQKDIEEKAKQEVKPEVKTKVKKKKSNLRKEKRIFFDDEEEY